ncbi:peptidoglycan-binding protein [Actinoplanes sp. CA-030573]|uniref:peptidoglycan-binding protein n=1 Tax=Actinoplanes sp. CA-030573 TaxID=3239898 RepID=UPI003D928D70
MSAADTLILRRRRFLTLIAVLLAVVVLVGVAAVLVGSRLRSPEQVAADAAPPSASLVTAEAGLRQLSEPVVLRGQLQASQSVKVRPPSAAVGPNSVVTRVLVKKGDRLREGRVLLERMGQPMVVLDLAFPLYRDISAGMTGPDVAEIQRALRRLGYRVSVSKVFDSATQKQVTRFFHDRGYDIGVTGDDPVGESPADVDKGATDPGPAKGTARIPQASVPVVAGRNQVVTKVHARVGQVLTDPGDTLLELDGKAPVIMAVADREQSSLLRAGLAATAVDDLTGDKAATTITSVGNQPVTGADGQNGFQVRFEFTGKAIGGGVNRSLRLDVQVASGATKVLAVPVTALYSRADGSTFVTTVSDHGDTADVTVTTGQIAGGWVEIREPYDPALADGVRVVVGEQQQPAG